jgi:hypothetical protein
MKEKINNSEVFCKHRLFPLKRTKITRANGISIVALILAVLLIAPLIPAQKTALLQPAATRLSSSRLRIEGQTATGLSSFYNPYWYADRKTTATLEITNNSQADRTLTPILLLRGVERVSLAPLTIRPRATTRLTLNQALEARMAGVRASGSSQRWGDGSRKRSLWGSALLEGESVEGISSWILSESPQESLSINTLFDAGVHATKVLSSMWWLPTSNSKVAYVLQNASDAEATIGTFLYADKKVLRGRSVTIPEGGSRLIDLRELLPDKKSLKQLAEVGMVRFVTSGSNGGLLGRALIVDENVGFSVPLMMHGIESHRSNVLQMPGTPFGRPDRSMGFPKRTRFTTQLLLTNTSDSRIDITATLDGRGPSGSAVSWDAPVITLAAYESRVVDLEKERAAGGSRVADGHVGVRLTHNGRVIDLLAEAVTVDQTLTFSFYDPFFDSATLARVNHAISFNLTGSKNTLLVLKNTSAETNRLGYSLNYEDAGVINSYRSAPIEIEPYAVKVINIKAIRDSGAPDVEGRRLPAGISFGNGSAYSERPVVIAGDPTFDATAGTCLSCAFPCEGCDPCVVDPSVCQGGVPPCTGNGELCCSACSGTKNACVIAASAALAAALSACATGPCDAEPDPDKNPECAICLAAAGAGYVAALFVCDITENNCKSNCQITHNCICP